MSFIICLNLSTGIGSYILPLKLKSIVFIRIDTGSDAFSIIEISNSPDIPSCNSLVNSPGRILV